jgi:hypothetical protein
MTEIGYCVTKLFGNFPNRILKKGNLLKGMLELVYTYLSDLWLQLKTGLKNAVDTHRSTYSEDIIGHFFIL